MTVSTSLASPFKSMLKEILKKKKNVFYPRIIGERGVCMILPLYGRSMQANQSGQETTRQLGLVREEGPIVDRGNVKENIKFVSQSQKFHIYISILI